MGFQSFLALTAASLAALHFLRGAMRDLQAPGGSPCVKCSSGGCPVGRKG
jgi:hypothetical protein